MASFRFNNGQKVASHVSGFKGKVVSRSEQLHGCNRYLVQPAVGEDGRLPDGYWHDEVELEAEDLLEVIRAPKGWKYNLGDKVESNISGLKGILTTRSEHMNGCMRYVISPKGTTKKLPESHWVDEGEIVLLKPSAVEAPKAKQAEKKTGGPVSSFR